MITWMQRHKKYLIITIWISTIAFVGAGFVGWGQYSYGDKAGAVAKVGKVEITMGELQKSYSRLFAQYNKMFQGNFDEEKAKMFGLQKQALQQLTNQALLLNLAHSYSLQVSDLELLTNLQEQEYFFKDGVFNKSIYKETLSRNNLTMKEYEEDLRKQLLIQKLLTLLPVEESDSEKMISNTVVNIADKIEYKLLDDTNLTVDSSDVPLKAFWETKKQNFMSETSYEVKYIKQEKVSNTHEDSKIAQHYEKNKTHFKDEEGKILSLDDSKEDVIDELNAKATKEKALRTYIAYKKRKLSNDVKVLSTTISQTENQFNAQILEKITALSPTSPFLKPIEMDSEYFTFELIKINPSQELSFEDAKQKVLPLFISETKAQMLMTKAQDSLESFQGTITDFITSKDTNSLTEMTSQEASNFLNQLFNSEKKSSIITLDNGKIVLYNILEQKILTSSNDNQENSIIQSKSSMFHEGLIKKLTQTYKTEIFIEGL